MTPEQLKRLEVLEGLFAQLVASDRYTISRLMQLMEGRNIQLGTAVGTQIGTAATQKLAVLGATPIVQQGAITSPTGGLTVDSQARTAITSIIVTLTNFGITA